MISFRLSDYLFTPRDLAALGRFVYARGMAHHFIDVLALIALIIFMRLAGIPGASIVALWFCVGKFALPRFALTDALDMLTASILLCAAFALWDMREETLFFLSFIAALLRWRIDSRLSIALALLCLIAIPVSLVLFQARWWLGGEAAAETIAVWAYYFLSIGVIKQIIELIATKHQKPA